MPNAWWDSSDLEVPIRAHGGDRADRLDASSGDVLRTSGKSQQDNRVSPEQFADSLAPFLDVRG